MGVSISTSADEAGLIKGLRARDSQAIESLYNMYFDRLYAFIFHSVKENQAAAEDVTQDVFVSAIKSAKNFKGNSRLFTWLAGIAHHKIVDYFRNEKKSLYHNKEEISNSFIAMTAHFEKSHSVAESLESAEIKLQIAQALDDLPLNYRQVLLFKYVEEMTVKEISQIMQRSPKAIDGLLTRARKSLKENISGLL